MTVLVMLLILVMFGIFLFLYRRALIARMLGMPPPLNAVNVQRDIPVSMPDGVRLPTDHYAPKMPGDYPTLLIRTPYGRGKELALFGGYALSEMPAQRFAERGFNVIVQGCRGCLESEGAFSAHGNEAADGKATVAWIEQQPWFNGVLGTWGPSYLGYTQWATAASAPPSLKAMLPAVTSSENFTVSHPDGAFGLETRLRWSQGIFGLNKTHDLPLVETIRQRYLGGAEKRLQSAFNHLPLLEADTTAVGEPIPLYRDILMQNRVDDPYWTVRDHSRTAMKAVAEREVAVHFVGGWYDYYLRGLLRDYHSLIGAGCRPYLTIGPWYHGDPKGLMAGVKEGITWFDAQLHSNPNALREKAVNIFVMGAEEWREMEVFPPPSSETPYYLHPDAELSTEHPPAGTEPDHYRYDPGDPTPAVGGALLALKGAGPVDNRQLELRADVLCFTTAVLDRAVEIIGAVRLDLSVSSSLAHTDFFGRLCDVDRKGISTNVCDGLFRIEPERGEGLPDGIRRLSVDMWWTAYRFQPGHRIRLQVSSGAHPRWNRNLGTGQPQASDTSMAIADQTIYHDTGHPSALIMPSFNGG